MEPIIEENQLVPVDAADARKKKNEDLIRKVKLLTQGNSKPLALPAPNEEQSVMSDTSRDPDFFMTNAKATFKKERDDSPTAMAARALAIINNKVDEGIEEEELKDEVHDLTDRESRKLGRLAIEEISKTEREMAKMFLELNELEDQIKGNIDLSEIENIMKLTSEVMSTHIASTNKIKSSIMSISKEAADAVKALDFYNLDDSDEETEKPKQPKKEKANAGLGFIGEEQEEEDEATQIEAGTLGAEISHERSKVEMYKTLDSMTTTMRNFTMDIEQRLENVYKNGASKKFGIDIKRENASQLSARSSESEGSEATTKIKSAANIGKKK